MLAAHLLAEIAGTAGHEGQRADVGMAGIKGRPQQCLTPVIHALEQGPGAGAGASRATHSPLTSPAAHGTSAWAQGREKGGWRGEERGHGHRQPWAPEARYFPRSRQEANLSQALEWEVRCPQGPDLHGSQTLLQARWVRQGEGCGPCRLVGGQLLPAVHKLSHIICQLPCRGELA